MKKLELINKIADMEQQIAILDNMIADTTNHYTDQVLLSIQTEGRNYRKKHQSDEFVEFNSDVVIKALRSQRVLIFDQQQKLIKVLSTGEGLT